MATRLSGDALGLGTKKDGSDALWEGILKAAQRKGSPTQGEEHHGGAKERDACVESTTNCFRALSIRLQMACNILFGAAPKMQP